MTIITDEMWKAFWDAADPAGGRRPLNVDAGLAAVAPLIAAAEREACARIAERDESDLRGYYKSPDLADGASWVAASIRARSS